MNEISGRSHGFRLIPQTKWRLMMINSRQAVNLFQLSDNLVICANDVNQFRWRYDIIKELSRQVRPRHSRERNAGELGQ